MSHDFLIRLEKAAERGKLPAGYHKSVAAAAKAIATIVNSEFQGRNGKSFPTSL